MPNSRKVFIVSDHTGLTAENIARALLTHFPGQQFRYERRPFVLDIPAVEVVLQEVSEGAAAGEKPLIFTTITKPEVLALLKTAPAQMFDLLTENLAALGEVFGEAPAEEARGHHDMQDSEAYLSRMNALDFALATDDGVGDKQYGLSDVILVGVSRAGKTPTSLFLALQHGIRASNYPLAEDDFERDDLPKPLQPYRDRLFGLTIDPKRLHAIRTQRKPNSKYASIEQCEYEVRRAEQLFARMGIPVKETTSSSVEEIAAGVMGTLRKAGRLES